MKQNMKHLVSFIALAVMMVSMFSVWVIPTVAASEDYSSMLRQALVIDPDWEDVSEGEYISYTFRGKAYNEKFQKTVHFASFADAAAFAAANNRTNPVFLLCEGEYTEKMEITGKATLIGPNAGMDPNVKTDDPRTAWTLDTKRGAEAVIKTSIVVRLSAASSDIVIDGLRFEDGGALVDTQRNSGASTLTVKNSVFDNAGNDGLSNRYALFLRSSGHTRTVKLENLYITNMNKRKPAKGTTYDLSENSPDLSFIAPFFSKLYADNIAYVDCRNGFLTHTWFAKGVSPIVEVKNSCFFNADKNLAANYALSMDNYSYDYDFTYTPSTSSSNAPLLGTESNPYSKDLNIAAATDRPGASLTVRNNIFYQASGKTGVIHYEFVNASSVVDIQNNFVYADDDNANNGATIMDSEFLYNSAGVDQSNCMIVKNNQLIGAYKVPALTDSNDATYIDMSDNYFATTSGLVVYAPIFSTEEDQRLIRDSFWIDEKMTKTGEAWKFSIGNWLLAWVDNFRYNVDLLIYEASDLDDQPFTFDVPDGFKVELYRSAYVSGDGVVTGAHDMEKIPNNKLTAALLGEDPYEPKEIYAKIIKEDDPSFAPFYKIRIENMGSLASLDSFAETFPADYFMYKAEVAGIENGAAIPYRWKGNIYKFEAGKNIFADFNEIFTYAASKGIESPTILLPAGVYTTDLVIPGSCTILGEQHGVNPNKTVVDEITKENVAKSAWILNPARDPSRETEFQAVIRTADGIDNYVITIDGIKMGKDCSYVDDKDRAGSNVTIFKNVLALNAGGGLDSKGTVNAYVFNFARSSVADYNYTYLYDCRISGLDGRVAFGPYHEKFVFDGCYFGDCINQSKFCLNFRSRDIPNPYYAFTNSYFYNNTGTNMASNYLFNFKDDAGNIAVKTNIVYNFDNNTFFNGLGKGRGFQIYFTGNNMKVNFTNNTFVQENDSDTLFVSTSTNTRFKCAKENVSNMMNIKGNRLIGKNCLPCTGGTGAGTMLDWSGNYFAATYDGAAKGPDGALRFGTISETSTYTYEQNTRVKVDYTFLDWDMTIRSDMVVAPEAVYSVIGSGEFDEKNAVYTDSVAADQTTYPIPLVAGGNSLLKIYSKKDHSADSQVTKLDLPNEVNTYYAVVSSTDGSVSKEVKIVINRALNSKNDLYYMDGFLIDSDAKTIEGYVDYNALEYNSATAVIEASAGATYGLYRNATCEAGDELIRPDLMFHNPCYFKITSEDGTKSDVYKLTFVDSNTIDPEEVDVAGITYIEGMNRVNTSTFEAEVLTSESTYTITPYAHFGGSLEILKGNTALVPNADGSYTISTPGSEDLTLTAIATSGNGENGAEYTLKFKKVKGSESELYAIEGAYPRVGGYLYNIGVADAAVIKATVSAGATYQVYEDFTCKTPVVNNLVTSQKDGAYRDVFVAYVKVTSEDGSSSSIHKVTIQSQASNTERPTITGTVSALTYNANATGEKEYTIYLPAGKNSIKLKGELVRDTADGYGVLKKDVVVAEMRFYADRNKTIEITGEVALTQKVTKVYMAMAEGSYATVVDDVVYNVLVPAFDGVLNIVSERESVNYKDAASLKNHWVKEYVEYLNDDKYGIFMGDNSGKLNIESKITRYEIATIASRVLGLDASKYTDANTKLDYADSIEDWAKPYVRAVTANGIMGGNGVGDKLYFNGNANATREQVIKVLVAVCMANDGILVDGATYYNSQKAALDRDFATYGFADANKVSDWAVPYMRLAVCEYKMIGGSGENGKLYLYPQNNITRAEVAKMVAVYYGY